MREYLQDVRDNWRDDYWRADHPEFQIAVMVAGFLLLSILRIGINIIDLLVTRRITSARPAA